MNFCHCDIAIVADIAIMMKGHKLLCVKMQGETSETDVKSEPDDTLNCSADMIESISESDLAEDLPASSWYSRFSVIRFASA